MKRNLKPYIIGIITALLIVSFHVGYRLHKIHSILKEPGDFERIKLIPKTIEFCAEQTDKLVEVNIGYGTFSSAVKFDLSSAGSMHTVIMGRADGVKFLIMPPNKPIFLSSASATEMDKLKKLPPDHPWRVLVGKDTDTIIDLLIRSEYAQLRPFPEVMLMSNSEFLAYLYQLVMKGTVSNRASEIFAYSTAHTRGLIHVVKFDAEKTRVACAIESTAKNIDVGFNFILSGDMTNNVIEVIEPILATLTFADQVDCDEEIIAAKILDAGIQSDKKDSQPAD